MEHANDLRYKFDYESTHAFRSRSSIDSKAVTYFSNIMSLPHHPLKYISCRISSFLREVKLQNVKFCLVCAILILLNCHIRKFKYQNFSDNNDFSYLTCYKKKTLVNLLNIMKFEFTLHLQLILLFFFKLLLF